MIPTHNRQHINPVLRDSAHQPPHAFHGYLRQVLFQPARQRANGCRMPRWCLQGVRHGPHGGLRGVRQGGQCTECGTAVIERGHGRFTSSLTAAFATG